MKQIIGVGFRARVGKDTTGDYLVKYHDFIKVAFADAVKEQAKAIFGLSDEQLYGNLKEVVDEYWNKQLQLWDVNIECFNCDFKASTILNEIPTLYPCPNCSKAAIWMSRLEASEDILKTHRVNVGWIEQLPITPRVLLQYTGTQMGRAMLHPDIWIMSLTRKIENSEKSVIVTDVRFPNEGHAILALGGRVFRVDRPNATTISGATAHTSETAMSGWKYWSGVLENTDSFQYLFDQIDKVVACQ